MPPPPFVPCAAVWFYLDPILIKEGKCSKRMQGSLERWGDIAATFRSLSSDGLPSQEEAPSKSIRPITAYKRTCCGVFCSIGKRQGGRNVARLWKGSQQQ